MIVLAWTEATGSLTGNGRGSSFTPSNSTLIVEKTPVAAGGGYTTQGGYVTIPVYPIPKLRKRESLRVKREDAPSKPKATTKKASRKRSSRRVKREDAPSKSKRVTKKASNK